ncbi:hypothetical protein AGDE_00771 [Angomonas deanei]|uniref:Uncharacterized protein n=1 Tax=Angomonas deanei TaxID=59799 RepID=S9UMF7_9TRYP|nr:hypothetical protein AGDE_08902 [Angomonas deanei]EPY43151.1 hypothetical protein AGDE_00771 [Angomonas deanei]CAD2216771.1 hypothetical protein, conserved [Angomonas deanei]|eukprot:EPY32027.1 hypothetical protein AGDE_08902 [Angomonas deanei]
MGRHGLGLHQTYMEAKALMERDYPTLVRRYVDSLSEGTTHVRREISTLLDVLSELNCTEKEWNGLVQGMDSAVKNDSTVLHFPSTGLYYPHHYLLQDFVNRASTIFPQHHDSAQVIRETISRNVLGEKMRSITDVHFNAMASLRWEGGGDKVRVGDLVVKDKATRCLLDNYEASADVIHGSLTDNLHPLWCELASSEGRLPEGLREIQTVHEAAQHTIHDVVLPLYGRNAAHLPVLPARSPFLKLAEELNVTGVEKMKTAFPAGYRPLLARPEESYGFYLVDEGRQWEWEEGPLAGALKQSLYKDQDNITRMRSPLMERSKKNMIARRGIRGEEARRFFLKPARKSGVLCVMRMTLPRGTAITSSLREVFQFATLSPSAIFQLLSP